MHITYGNISAEEIREAEPVMRKIYEFIGAQEAELTRHDTGNSEYEVTARIHKYRGTDIRVSVEVILHRKVRIVRYYTEEEMNVSEEMLAELLCCVKRIYERTADTA